MVVSRSLRSLFAGAAGTAMVFLCCATAQAAQRPINVSDHDRQAASQTKNVHRHARPANTPAGRDARKSEIASRPGTSRRSSGDSGDSGDSNRNSVRFPADLQFLGGQVITSAEQHLIFVNLASATTCNSIATCWGNPFGFLRDLGKSDFIRVVDQYTGNHEEDRYTVSPNLVNVNFTTTAKAFTDADIQAIVHAVVTNTGSGTGYDNLYHVFLVPGQDECFTSSFRTCYSPDNPATFFFCAYHSSVDFTDIGHVLYSVEPFQNVPGCSVRPDTPNGPLVDSTNNVLSHETIEAITDPDGDAWFNLLDNGLFGEEIGDECSFLLFTATDVFFDPSNVRLNGKRYAIQPEYSNKGHACVARSDGHGGD